MDYEGKYKNIFSNIPDWIFTIGVMVTATALGYLFSILMLSDTNIAMVYILGVLIISAYCDRQFFGIAASAVSVIAFNFFFVDPFFSLRAHGRDYPMTFLTMFGVAFITSTLAEKVKKQARFSEQARAVAQREKLRADLLRAISHDLRTPLTAISGNASNLYSNYEQFSEEEKKLLYNDIYEDSMWLINLSENLLSITRIEDGRMDIRISPQLMEDVVEAAVAFCNRKSMGHRIKTAYEEELIIANIDARLITQVIINLVENAVKYSAKDTTITINVKRDNNKVVVSVADNGMGIPDDEKQKVFDMFYSGNNGAGDGRRSLGVGLALCKTIVEAHGGMIGIEDNTPSGTRATFSVPEGRVEFDES